MDQCVREPGIADDGHEAWDLCHHRTELEWNVAGGHAPAENRYAISSWMPLQHNNDGSIDLCIRRESPGNAIDANWLPAPEGNFNITLRMYWPKNKAPSINDGTWAPPAVVQVPHIDHWNC
jgi:hypothetical protein